MLNIKAVFRSFPQSYKYILQDKVNLIFTTTPIVIGIILFYFLGSSFYSYGMEWGQGVIESHVSSEGFASFLSWLMVAILTVFLFFFINWTFVMVVTLIASPFNDFLSERIEKKILAQENPDLSDSLAAMLKELLHILWIESKKIVVIGILTVFALLLSFIPFLVPVSLILTALLFASQFTDYSWSRHKLGVRACLGDVKKNFFSYLTVGAFFMLLVSIPVVNLLVPAWATSYFTILWVKNDRRE